MRGALGGLRATVAEALEKIAAAPDSGLTSSPARTCPFLLFPNSHLLVPLPPQHAPARFSCSPTRTSSFPFLPSTHLLVPLD